MSLEVYLAFVLASAAIIIVPGPTVSVIIANSLRHGAKAGLLNVAGTQTGLAIIIVILAAGLTSILGFIAQWFYVVKLLGAAYLLWLGVKLLRSDGHIAEMAGEAPAGGRFFKQGLLVVLSNPKVLVFYSAFLPQFIDPVQISQNSDFTSSYAFYLGLLGLTFMVIAGALDSGYALLAAHAREKLSRILIRRLECVSGICLILGSIWLALSKR